MLTVFKTLSPALPHCQVPTPSFTVFGRLELEWCEKKILLGWLELEAGAGAV